MALDASSLALTVDGNDILLQVRVKPRGRKNGIDGQREGALIIAVTAPPAEGAANAAVLELLATVLHRPKSSLSIVRGPKSRDKVVRLASLSLEEARRRLESV